MQEFNLTSSYLTVEENIYLGREPDRPIWCVDRWQGNHKADGRAVKLSLGVVIDPKAVVEDLTVAQRQFVEIAKALSLGAELVIMDEPSSTLTEHELEYLI